MSSPSQPWPTPPVIDAEVDSQLILLECRPRAALLALRRIDDPCFYPLRVRHYELKHDRLSRELQEAQSAASKRRLSRVVDMAVVGLQKARDRQARFTADPQRFIEERRAELAKEIAELHDELATLRRSVGLPPLPLSSRARHGPATATLTAHAHCLADDYSDSEQSAQASAAVVHILAHSASEGVPPCVYIVPLVKPYLSHSAQYTAFTTSVSR